MALQGKSRMLAPKLDVVIVNYNAGSILESCVESVLASQGVRVRCIIIDNASVDGSADFCTAYSSEQVVLLRNSANLGFSSAVNQGVALSNGAWVMLLNPDTLVPAHSLRDLLLEAQAHTASERVGVLGCLVLNPDGSEQRGCRRDIPTPAKTLAHAIGLQYVFRSLQFNHTGRTLPAEPQTVGAISGSCMLLSRQAYDDIAGFNEAYFLHFEDLDYCIRLHDAGWKVVFVPSISIKHLQGVSSAREPIKVILHKHSSMLRFFYTHGGGQKVVLPILAPLIALRTLAQIAVVLCKKIFPR